MSDQRPRLALVYGTLPTVEEVDQFQVIGDVFDITLISSASIVSYLQESSFFNNLRCLPLPDYDEQPTFLPGLENVLEGFDQVLVKERLGAYAFQAVKAKVAHKFCLSVLVDNLTCFPGEDIARIKTVRNEISQAADFLLVQSEVARQTLLAEGCPEEKIRKIPSYSQQRFDGMFEKADKKSCKLKSLEALGCNERDRLILFYGNVEWEEGLLDLLHAFKLVQKSNSAYEHQLKIAVCGIGSFVNEVKQRSIDLKIDDNLCYVLPGRENFQHCLQAADALYLASYPGRDRVDGDPHRILCAMAHGLPVIAPRVPIVEELIGKHRFDYCSGSILSLSQAIDRSLGNNALRHDTTHKNLAKIRREHNADLLKSSLLELFKTESSEASVQVGDIDQQIVEIEAKIAASQYLAAVTRIEGIFEKGIDSVHHQAKFYQMIGDCFTKLGDTEGGKSAYLNAIELDPFSGRAYIGLGTISLTQGNYDIGIVHFQKAVSLSPRDEMANLGLGLAFHGIDELEEANNWVLKSLEINIENSAAIYTLVKIAHDREDYTEAEEVLSKYLLKHPHDQNISYTLGGILHKLGKPQEVLELMEPIVKLNPMDLRAQDLIRQAKRVIKRTGVSTA